VNQAAAHEGLDRRGLVAGFTAYGLWGIFPLYFHLLGRSGALEVVAHRIFWTLVFCIVVVAVTRSWRQAQSSLSDSRLVRTLLGAGLLVSLNWLIYVYAVLTDRVVDASLGYFMNPLVTALLGVLVLRERVNRLQITAFGIGLAAVLVIVIGVGRLPWIGLGLALSFGFYSLAKSHVGKRTTPVIGIGIEAMALAPLSGAYIVFLEITRHGTATTISWTYFLLLAAAGLVTAVPLLLFAMAAARLPLTVVALLQYVAPVLQFLIGVLVFHEHMPVVRWIGFVLVWLALVVLTWDMVRRMRQTPAA